MGPADANIRAVITADDRASKDIASFGRRADKTFQTTMRNARRLAILGFGAVVAGAFDSVKAFDESQAATAQLNTVLKATKGVAGVTAKSVIKYAEAMQQVTKFSDEEIISAQNTLLTFKAVGKNIFPRATAAALDMSQALGKDLQGSVTQLGKAMQDPVKGATALSKQGSLAKTELAHLKKMAEAGSSVFEQQTYILEALEGQYKGSAEAAGKTFGGAIKILGHNLSDVQEVIGKLIVERLGPLAAKFNEWVKTHKPQITKAFQDIIDKIIALGTFIFEHRKIILILIGVYAALKTALFLHGAVKAFMGVMSAIRGAALVTSGVVKGLSTAIMGVKSKGLGGLVGFKSGLWRLMVNPFTLALVVIAAAAVAIGLAIAGARKALDGFEASMNRRPSIDQYLKTYNAIKKKSGLAAAQRYARSQNSGGGGGPATGGGGSFASGGVMQGGTTNLVGERGPELVTPGKTSRIYNANDTNKLLGGKGSNVTFNVNIGMFAGTPMERRKIAAILFRDFKDVAAKYGVTPSNLLDGANGAVIR